MKFSCNQQELVKKINIVSKAVSIRTTIPSLKGILMEVEDGVLKMTASDMDITVETKLEVNDSENGSIVVPAKLFADVIRQLPNTDINISSNDDNINIVYGTSNNTITGISADEYPIVKYDQESKENVEINKEILSKMIKNTSFATSLDQTRGVLTGVLMEIKPEHLRFVAIDGFRLAINTEKPVSNAENKLIISGKLLNEINKIINEDILDENVKISFDGKSAIITSGDEVISVRLLNGEFIKYEDIIPKDASIKVIGRRDEIISAVERASIFTEGKNNLIKVSVKDHVMTVSSNSEEGGSIEDILINKTGDDIDIGFNARYILDVLKVISDEEIVMNFNSPITPCTITPVEGDNYKYLLLPVRLGNM